MSVAGLEGQRATGWQRLTLQLTVLIAVAVVGPITAAGLLGYWAVATIDGQSLDRQTRLATTSIHERFRQIPMDQEASTVWNEAVVHVRAGDRAWMSDNMGVWMATYFGHDQAFVLDPQDRPIYAMIGGADAAPEAYLGEQPAIGPLVDRLRAEMAAASQGKAESTASVGALGAADYVTLDGLPAIVSVKPIVPDSPAISQAPGTEFLHVAVRSLSPDFLADIASEYGLQDLNLLPPGEAPPAASMPIWNVSGKLVAYVAWTPFAPGQQLLGTLAPPLLGAAIAALVLLTWLTLRLWRSTRQLEESQRRAVHQATHDSLTGLPNRAHFDAMLQEALTRLKESGNPISVLAIDIDRFKNVNDTLGHPAGDELVRELADRLLSVAEPGDCVARVGGDEFAILSTGRRHEGSVAELANRIQAVVQQPFTLDGDAVFCSVSIGIVSTGDVAPSASGLMRQADIALYDAKAGGRSRFRFFAKEMGELIQRRRVIEHDLRAALKSGEGLRLLFQPLIEPSGRIVGAEALLRWDHPVHGGLSPDIFIGIAEERGLIEMLGEWVLRGVVAAASELPLPWVAVNVSPVQLQLDGFADRLLSICAAAGIAPSRLQVEITETALIEPFGAASSALLELRQAGISIALDDFGTGYSSMNYLRQYPIDKIKIDRSFVAQLGASREADAVVRAIVALGRAMQKRVVAEGVETAEQRDYLAAIGCHELQGYLMFKPLPAYELAALLTAMAHPQHRKLA